MVTGRTHRKQNVLNTFSLRDKFPRIYFFHSEVNRPILISSIRI